jgi:hypothetical protein
MHARHRTTIRAAWQRLSVVSGETGSVKAYRAAFEKYRRASEIQPADTAAHHSWYYGLLELAKKSKGAKKKALLEQAKSVSREQERRRRLVTSGKRQVAQ